MKRCPECGREYDNSMAFCLDDGAELLYGPASAERPPPAILTDTAGVNEAATRAQIYTTDRTAVYPARINEESSSKAFDKRIILAPLALAMIVLGGFLGYRYFSTASSKQIESIAVMPFVNESSNADVEYLSDGMTETLISSLSQLSNLTVKGRSSVFRYKGKDLDTKTLGMELGVQAILYGRVIQRGDQLTLSLELLDAVTENVIWSGKYDRKQADVVTLQSEIARDVSIKLKTRLSGLDTAKVEKGYTTDPEAYKLYLQGRFYWNKRSEADLNKSIEYFNQAIARDPSYALAYAGLADVYGVMINYVSDPQPDETYPKARSAAEKALQLDPELAAPHATLGYILHEYELRHAEAEKEFKRSIELDPNNSSAHQWYGEYLSNMGRFAEGTAEQKRALELDPLSPVINVTLGNAYRAEHRYDEAIAQFKKALELDPKFSTAMANLRTTYALAGRFEEAIESTRKRRLDRGDPVEQVQKDMAAALEAYRSAGASGFWRWALETSQRNARAADREVRSFDLAAMQVGIGDKDGALITLERAFEHERFILVRLKSSPQFTQLQGAPRFKELLRKVGLPE